MLKKSHYGVIVQLCSFYVQICEAPIPICFERVSDNHSKVFVDMPKELPPSWEHDHDIHLIPMILLPTIRPYRYMYAQKSEVEHMVEEILEDRIIGPTQRAFSAAMIMVYKKDVSWCMCPY